MLVSVHIKSIHIPESSLSPPPSLLSCLPIYLICLPIYIPTFWLIYLSATLPISVCNYLPISCLFCDVLPYLSIKTPFPWVLHTTFKLVNIHFLPPRRHLSPTTTTPATTIPILLCISEGGPEQHEGGAESGTAYHRTAHSRGNTAGGEGRTEWRERVEEEAMLLRKIISS